MFHSEVIIEIEKYDMASPEKCSAISEQTTEYVFCEQICQNNPT